MYRSLLFRLQPIHPSQERLCTDLSYYDYSQYILPSNVYVHYVYGQYILPRNVYVQISLITIIANTSFPETFMYRSLLFRLQPIQPSQKRLCTDLSYYNYSQYILPRNVYVQISLITFIANPSQERLCTLQVSLFTIKANTSFPGTFVSSSLLLQLQPIQPSQDVYGQQVSLLTMCQSHCGK